MKKKKKKKLIAACCALLLLASCGEEPEPDGGTADEGRTVSVEDEDVEIWCDDHFIYFMVPGGYRKGAALHVMVRNEVNPAATESACGR